MQTLEETLDISNEQELLLNSQSTESNSHFFGPVLPPHFLEEKKTKKIYGPTLPDQLSEDKKKETEKDKMLAVEPEDEILIGPELPECFKCSQSSSGMEDKSTANVKDHFGPSVTLMTEDDITAYKYINMQNLSEKTLNVSKAEFTREKWMTELPKKKGVNFGIFPRHFKSRIQTDKESDDSVWTDTPADKSRKDRHKKRKDHKEIFHLKRLKERDEEMEKLTKKIEKKLNKKRQSLLEMHLKNMKKNKKMKSEKEKRKEKSVPERRPFDRNVDLQILKFDENQKKAILNKSLFLNDRFAPGQSKYL